MCLLLPSLERIGEDALAGRALFHREDGAAVVVVDQRNVEPGALLLTPESKLTGQVLSDTASAAPLARAAGFGTDLSDDQ